MVSTASERDKERILEIFTNEFIRDLILCNADELWKIIIIYDHLHELSERYCLEYYLKDINLDSTIASMPIRKNEENGIKPFMTKLLLKLQLLSSERQSIYIPLIISDMQGTTVASEIKNS